MNMDKWYLLWLLGIGAISDDPSMDGGIIAGIVCAVLALLLAVALFVCWRLKPHWVFHRQTPFNTFIKVELKPYSHYQAPQRVSRLESSGSDSEEKRYSFKNNMFQNMKGGGGEAGDVNACPIYASIQDDLKKESSKSNNSVNHSNCSLHGPDKRHSKKGAKAQQYSHKL